MLGENPSHNTVPANTLFPKVKDLYKTRVVGWIYVAESGPLGWLDVLIHDEGIEGKRLTIGSTVNSRTASKLARPRDHEDPPRHKWAFSIF